MIIKGKIQDVIKRPNLGAHSSHLEDVKTCYMIIGPETFHFLVTAFSSHFNRIFRNRLIGRGRPIPHLNLLDFYL